MGALFQRGAAQSDEHPVIEPLVPGSARELRLPWLSHFNTVTLHAHLQANPSMCLWVPRTGEYILAERWRHLSDVANIVEVTARKGRVALVNTLVEQLAGEGYKLIICADEVWRDHQVSWTALGFNQVEKIVFFQRDLRDKLLNIASGPPLDLQYRRLSTADISTLLEIDHNSFPPLWWNSRTEFDGYLQVSNVHVYGAFRGDEPVGYASFTMYDGWAHLDRLAVASQWQSQGYGAAQLLHVLRAMVSLNARLVRLSTQEENSRSHRLYTTFGFHRLPDAMAFYGKEIATSR